MWINKSKCARVDSMCKICILNTVIYEHIRIFLVQFVTLLAVSELLRYNFRLIWENSILNVEDGLENPSIHIKNNRFYYLHCHKNVFCSVVTSQRMRQNPFMSQEAIALYLPYITDNFFAVIYMNGHRELYVCVISILWLVLNWSPHLLCRSILEDKWGTQLSAFFVKSLLLCMTCTLYFFPCSKLKAFFFPWISFQENTYSLITLALRTMHCLHYKAVFSLKR